MSDEKGIIQNYQARLGRIIRDALPREPAPRFGPAQIEKLKTAGAITLALIGVMGAITISAIAPNAFVAINKLFLKNHKTRRFTRKQKEQKLIRTFYYLKETGYIKMKRQGKDFRIFITSLGKKKLKKLNMATIAIEKSSPWDGKWWEVAADIPTEDYKWAADLFRQKLKDMSFFPLQRTLWFYPFDPRREIEFIIRNFGIESFVTVMEIDRLDKDDEKKMRKFFRGQGIIG